MTAPPSARRREDSRIEDAAAWVLRIGVIVSVAVMLLGLVLSFARGAPSVERMESLRFVVDLRPLLSGVLAGDGTALMELGILLLVLTPIVRVFSSMVLFAAVERDWFYAFITLLVLLMTLLSLVVLR